MSLLQVSVGIIQNTSREILITRRAFHLSHGGLWEIPGGKVELQETPYDALLREMREEVGLCIKQAAYLGEVCHAYPLKAVCLHVFQITKYTGHAICRDGQLELRWVPKKNLTDFEFPEANQKIMNLFNLNAG